MLVDFVRQAQEKVGKREEAQAVAEKAKIKLDKAKALLEEAKALVTVYVVRKNEIMVVVIRREIRIPIKYTWQDIGHRLHARSLSF